MYITDVRVRVFEERTFEYTLIMGLRSSYSESDEILICQNYLRVSEDPAVGTDQTGKTFWQKMSTLFNGNKPETQHRTQTALRTKWFQIARDVGKFVGAMAKVMRH